MIKRIKFIMKMYLKGYRLISLCDYHPEADQDIYCLIHKSKIPKDFEIKDHQYWLLSIEGYRVLKKYGTSYLIE